MKRANGFWAVLVLCSVLPPGMLAAPALNFQDSSELQRTFDRWNEPVAPFRIAGNIYFVGMRNISSYLITGNEGHVLLDTGFSNSVPIIRGNVVRLGFSPRDIKYILSSHAHCDHVAGHAEMKRITGARIAASRADAALLRSGGRRDFLFGDNPLMHFEAVRPDLLIREGEHIRLGTIDLTAHLTPGHTPGCTTWTMEVEEGGERRKVVFFGSTSINPGTRLTGNKKYPAIQTDMEDTYGKLRALPCDIFLAPHPEQFSMHEKLQAARGGGNPFVDSAELQRFLDNAENTFREEVRKQTAPRAERPHLP